MKFLNLLMMVGLTLMVGCTFENLTEGLNPTSLISGAGIQLNIAGAGDGKVFEGDCNEEVVSLTSSCGEVAMEKPYYTFQKGRPNDFCDPDGQGIDFSLKVKTLNDETIALKKANCDSEQEPKRSPATLGDYVYLHNVNKLQFYSNLHAPDLTVKDHIPLVVFNMKEGHGKIVTQENRENTGTVVTDVLNTRALCHGAVFAGNLLDFNVYVQLHETLDGTKKAHLIVHESTGPNYPGLYREQWVVSYSPKFAIQSFVQVEEETLNIKSEYFDLDIYNEMATANNHGRMILNIFNSSYEVPVSCFLDNKWSANPELDAAADGSGSGLTLTH